jgi:hypothetical protein
LGDREKSRDLIDFLFGSVTEFKVLLLLAK